MNIPKIKALVPMKGHSERVPHKNIRPLAGKPACHWILDALSRSKYIDAIIVDTDDDEIAATVSANFPKAKVFKRPDFLLGDMVSIQPLIEYDMTLTEGDYFLQTHSTNPLVTTETIDRAIETFFAQTEHDALFSVTKVQTRFYRADGRGINHDPKHLIRTQDLDPIYEENSCIYIFSRQTNEKVKNRLGSNPLMFPIDRLEAGDIDNIEDFFWCEFLLKRKQENNV
jgi:N-acylneuraminate cytidylyltransferase